MMLSDEVLRRAWDAACVAWTTAEVPGDPSPEDKAVAALRAVLEEQHLAWHGPDPDRMQALLRDISELLADAGVPGGTPLSQGVIWLRERAERAEAK